MDQVNSKEDLINYFIQGCKKEDQLNIGVEHEKFLFKNNKRIGFETVTKIFNFLEQFGWKPIKEKKNIVALRKGKKTITLEPGNQIEISGEALNSIHLNCSESYKFLDELKKACSSLDLKMMSISFDPFSKLENVPNTPKQRYKIMTEEMPKNGKLSLEMMYQTCGTQINLDYISEKDFSRKFKLSCYLVPLSIAIFANSPIKENKLNGYFSYRSKVWQNTSRAGLPKSFLGEMNFEKYVDMAIDMPLLFIYKNSNHHKTKGRTFREFMEGKISISNIIMASIILFAVVFISIWIEEWDNIISFIVQAGLVSITLNITMMVLGYYVAKFLASGIEQRKAISLECGLQNGTLAVFVSTQIFDEVVYMVPTAAYALIMFLTSIIFVFIIKNKS